MKVLIILTLLGLTSCSDKQMFHTDFLTKTWNDCQRVVLQNPLDYFGECKLYTKNQKFCWEYTKAKITSDTLTCLDNTLQKVMEDRK